MYLNLNHLHNQKWIKSQRIRINENADATFIVNKQKLVENENITGRILCCSYQVYRNEAEMMDRKSQIRGGYILLLPILTLN